MQRQLGTSAAHEFADAANARMTGPADGEEDGALTVAREAQHNRIRRSSVAWLRAATSPRGATDCPASSELGSSSPQEVHL